MSYHCYADDTQAYLVIKPIDNWINIATRMEACLSDISAWMKSNMLKLNQDKTELIIFTTKQRTKDFVNCSISFDGHIVSEASVVKNLGVLFDKTLTMEKQVSFVPLVQAGTTYISSKEHSEIYQLFLYYLA